LEALALQIVGRNERRFASALIGIWCIVIFLLEGWFAGWDVITGISARDSLRMGGAAYSIIFEAGQLHRLLSAAFLHINFSHLISNLGALYLFGQFLERFIGPLRFWLIFILSAVGGSLLSLLWHDSTIVTCGASGGILGLLAASAVLAKRVQEGTLRKLMVRRYIPVLILQALPFFQELFVRIFLTPSETNTAAMQIDHAAHLGGAISGLLLGVGLLALWPAFQVTPRYPRVTNAVAAALAAGSVCAAAFGFLSA